MEIFDWTSFSALRCAARRPAAARNCSFALLPSTYPFSAQARLGPYWANLATRLTALSVGVMGWNSRAEVIEQRRTVEGCDRLSGAKRKATPLQVDWC
jgi:hypothetical protein